VRASGSSHPTPLYSMCARPRDLAQPALHRRNCKTAAAGHGVEPLVGAPPTSILRGRRLPVQVDATGGSATSSRASSASAGPREHQSAAPLLERPSRPVADCCQPDSARHRPPPAPVSTSSSSPSSSSTRSWPGPRP
jgi:hypothetical protein